MEVIARRPLSVGDRRFDRGDTLPADAVELLGADKVARLTAARWVTVDTASVGRLAEEVEALAEQVDELTRRVADLEGVLCPHCGRHDFASPAGLKSHITQKHDGEEG